MAAASVSAAPDGSSLHGLWGGDRLQLTLGADGGRLAGDCVSGSLNGPLTLAQDGSFHASGSFEHQQPGPARADIDTDTGNQLLSPADYAGAVSPDGLSMRLSIRTAGATEPQVVTLRKGVKVKLIRCL